MNKGTVSLVGLEFFAHHGLYDFERENGNTFWVDIHLTKSYTDTLPQTLDTTVDYEKVFTLIDAVMQEPEALLETVAIKIKNSIIASFDTLEKLQIIIKKNNPPIKNAKLNYSSFELVWLPPESKNGEN